MVLSIEAKKISGSKWEAYIDNGRESTGVDVYEWAKQAEESGVGEILLTSVDNEGTRKGFDIELIKTVSLAVDLPVIASGGMGSVQHLTDVVNEGYADAVAMADVLHYNRLSINDIRKRASDSGLSVRVES
jgi:cyclase